MIITTKIYIYTIWVSIWYILRIHSHPIRTYSTLSETGPDPELQVHVNVCTYVSGVHGVCIHTYIKCVYMSLSFVLQK